MYTHPPNFGNEHPRHRGFLLQLLPHGHCLCVAVVGNIDSRKVDAILRKIGRHTLHARQRMPHHRARNRGEVKPVDSAARLWKALEVIRGWRLKLHLQALTSSKASITRDTARHRLILG
jgi:hypothetical protein